MLSKIIRILVLATLISAPAYALAFDPASECDPEKFLDFEMVGSSDVQAYFLSSGFGQNAKCDDTKCVLCFSSDTPFFWKSASTLLISNWSDKQLVVYNLKLNFEQSPASVALQISGKNIVLENLQIVGTSQQTAMAVAGNGHKVNNSSIGIEAKPFAKGVVLGNSRSAANNFESNGTQIFANESLIVLNNEKGFGFADQLQIPMNLAFAVSSSNPLVIDQSSFGVVCSKVIVGKLDDVDIQYCPSDEAGENKFNVLAGVMPSGVVGGQVRVFKIAINAVSYFDVLNDSMVCPVSAITEPFYMTNNSVARVVEAGVDSYKFECPAVAENSLKESAIYFMVYEGAAKDEVVVDANGSNFLTYIATSKSVISVIGAASIPGTVSDATGGAGVIEIGGTGNAIEAEVPIETAPDGTPLIVDTGSTQGNSKAASKTGEQTIGQGAGGGCGGQQSLSDSKMPSAVAMVVGLLAMGGLPALIPARIRARRKH